MTIPIKPGPFSFLAGLGQAGGIAVSEAEKEREKRLKEDRERINQMILLRQQGLIPPESFSSPEAMALYARAGITPISSEYTSREYAEKDLRGVYQNEQPAAPMAAPVPALGPGLGPNPLQGFHPGGGSGFTLPMEQMITGGAPPPQPQPQAQAPMAAAPLTENQVIRRKLAGIPGRLETGREMQAEGTLAAEAAQSRAAVPKAQLEGATARAQLPGAELTAVTQQHGIQDKTLNEDAYRIVVDEYLKTNDGRGNYTLPTSAQAWSAAQRDPRISAYRSALTEPYFAAAIQSLSENLQKLDISRLGAQNRGPGLDDYLRLQLMGAGIRKDLIKALPEPTNTDRGLALAWDAILGRAKGDTVKVQKLMRDPAYKQYRDAAQKIQQYEEANQQEAGAARGTVTDVTREASRMSGSGSRVRSPSGQSGRKFSDEAVDGVVNEMLKQAKPNEDLKSIVDEDIQSGAISASDGAAIKARLDEIDLITGNRRPYKPRTRLTKPTEIKPQYGETVGRIPR